MKKVKMTRGELRAYEAYGKQFKAEQIKAKREGIKLPRKLGKAQFSQWWRLERETEQISGRELAKRQTGASFITKEGVKIKSYTSQQWKQKYARYTQQYEAKQKALQKKGLTLADEKLTRGQFKATYKGRETTRREQGVKTDIISEIVKSQAYTSSTKQAKSVREGLQKFVSTEKGIKLPSLEEIKVKGAKEALKPINDQLKAQHPEWTVNQRGAWITENIFGGSK